MLAMIGETFGDEGQVMGAVVSVRRTQDKLAVWTQWCSPEHEKTIRSIGYGPLAEHGADCFSILDGGAAAVCRAGLAFAGMRLSSTPHPGRG
jgi:hypothetical protein